VGLANQPKTTLLGLLSLFQDPLIRRQTDHDLDLDFDSAEADCGTLRRHFCLLTAAAYASCQVSPILRRSFLTVYASPVCSWPATRPLLSSVRLVEQFYHSSSPVLVRVVHYVVDFSFDAVPWSRQTSGQFLSTS